MHVLWQRQLSILSTLCGTEAAFHAVRSVFIHDDSDAILLVNAINSLNRYVALHNIQQPCPPLACVFVNTYHSPASLFLVTPYSQRKEPHRVIPGHADICYCNDSTDLSS